MSHITQCCEKQRKQLCFCNTPTLLCWVLYVVLYSTVSRCFWLLC